MQSFSFIKLIQWLHTKRPMSGSYKSQLLGIVGSFFTVPATKNSSLVLFDTNQREMGKKTGLFDINQAYATGNRINVRI